MKYSDAIMPFLASVTLPIVHEIIAFLIGLVMLDWDWY
jgi:hypothetical protein